MYYIFDKGYYTTKQNFALLARKGLLQDRLPVVHFIEICPTIAVFTSDVLHLWSLPQIQNNYFRGTKLA